MVKGVVLYPKVAILDREQSSLECLPVGVVASDIEYFDPAEVHQLVEGEAVRF